jgi:thiamine monophosphate synthase
LPLAAARKVVGPHKIVGVSTHDHVQAQEAERNGADYIGFGPLFGTTTKATGYSARGLEQLRRSATRDPYFGSAANRCHWWDYDRTCSVRAGCRCKCGGND